MHTLVSSTEYISLTAFPPRLKSWASCLLDRDPNNWIHIEVVNLVAEDPYRDDEYFAGNTFDIKGKGADPDRFSDIIKTYI